MDHKTYNIGSAAQFRISFTIEECAMVIRAVAQAADEVNSRLRQHYKICGIAATEDDTRLVFLYRETHRKYLALLEQLQQYNDCLKKDASTSDGLVSQVQS